MMSSLSIKLCSLLFLAILAFKPTNCAAPMLRRIATETRRIATTNAAKRPFSNTASKSDQNSIKAKFNAKKKTTSKKTEKSKKRLNSTNNKSNNGPSASASYLSKRRYVSGLNKKAYKNTYKKASTPYLSKRRFASTIPSNYYKITPEFPLLTELHSRREQTRKDIIKVVNPIIKKIIDDANGDLKTGVNINFETVKKEADKIAEVTPSVMVIRDAVCVYLKRKGCCVTYYYKTYPGLYISWQGDYSSCIDKLDLTEKLERAKMSEYLL
eukprot:225707_1